MFIKFDIVVIKTTKNLKYINNPTSEQPSPKGYWAVSNIVDDDLLIHKGPILVRIPQADVLKVVDHASSIRTIHNLLGKMSDG